MTEYEHSSPAISGRLAFVGDLMLGRKVSAQLLAGRPPKAFWGDVLPHCLAADAVIGNLECPISDTQERWRGIKAFRLCASPRVVEILAAGNVKCVSLANNHLLDCATEGLIRTRDHLARAAIAHAGAGMNLAETKRTNDVPCWDIEHRICIAHRHDVAVRSPRDKARNMVFANPQQPHDLWHDRVAHHRAPQAGGRHTGPECPLGPEPAALAAEALPEIRPCRN